MLNIFEYGNLPSVDLDNGSYDCSSSRLTNGGVYFGPRMAQTKAQTVPLHCSVSRFLWNDPSLVAGSHNDKDYFTPSTHSTNNCTSLNSLEDGMQAVVCVTDLGGNIENYFSSLRMLLITYDRSDVSEEMHAE